MKTIKIIDLLNKIANEEEAPTTIKYQDDYYNLIRKYNEDWEEYEFGYKNLDGGYLNIWRDNALNDEVEILEEEKELHANDIEFNINVDKRNCVITLDENDLGIDKLHLENCYFYKENDKWYVKKYDFKNFNLEEKKIPEKIFLEDMYAPSEVKVIDVELENKINEIIDYLDYLKSKGE